MTSGRNGVSELSSLTLVDALSAINRRECSAEEIACACLERIAAREPEVGAWQWLEREDQVLAHVRAAAESSLRGLLCGVKDTIDTADMPTEYGSPLYAGHRPAADAAPVALLRRAGVVVPGKTVATEFAYFTPGKTVNPHNAERSPGGSSSGSAAAVADAMVPIALGAQTAGSVTRPAAYCGCVGYVGSHGGLPIDGVRSLSPSLDTLGVFARQVDDVQIIRDILIGREPALRPREWRSEHVRLALADGSATGPIDEQMRAAVSGFAETLESAGARIEALGLTAVLADLTAAHEVIMAFEAARELAVEAARGEGMSEQLRVLIDTGWNTSEETYRAAQDRISAAAREVSAALESVDAVIAPAAPGAAPRGPETGSPHASRPWQALKLPAVTLPVARTAEGLPLGVQLIGKRNRDDELLALASWACSRLPTTIPTTASA